MAYSKKFTLSHAALQLMIEQDGIEHVNREYSVFRALHGQNNRARQPVGNNTLLRESNSGSAHPPMLIDFVSQYISHSSKRTLHKRRK